MIMGKHIISPYNSLRTEGEDQELLWEAKENGHDDFFLVHDKFEVIEWKAKRYWYKDETIDLDELIDQAHFLQHGYIEFGIILWEIKWKKLYKERYRNFDDFSKKEIKVCAWQANRIIEASRIALLLISSGFEYIPTCESQARVLAKYSDDDIVDYWGEITEKYKGKEYELTAKQIWKEIRLIRIRNGEEVEEGKWRNIKVKLELYKKLMADAMAHNLSLIEYFEFCLGDLELAKPAEYTPAQIKIIDELEKSWLDTA